MPSSKKIDLKKMKAAGEISAGLTRKENDEIMEYTKGFEVADHPRRKGVVSFAYLENLTEDQLVDEFVYVHQESMLKKWRILWVLRQRFPGDAEFGQYLTDLKHRFPHGLSVGGQQEVTRALHCGRFCERYKINDLSSLKLSPTVISELTRPINDSISDNLYLEFLREADEGKKITVKEAKLRIKQAAEVIAIDHDLSGIAENMDVSSIVDQSEDIVKTYTWFEDEAEIPWKSRENGYLYSDRVKAFKPLYNWDISDLEDEQILTEIKYIISLYDSLPLSRRKQLYKSTITFLKNKIKGG